ncbi:MAG TPA: heme-binding protein [Caulobacteraceae bacterium]|nr:heme-binding protein [Caulobacteraceae bacterium]
MRMEPSLEFADAEAIAVACRAAAEHAGASVAIAVVDDAGGLLHLQRLDGAKAHAADLAHRKARTAAALGLSTAILEQMARAGRLPPTDLLALGGGLPVLKDGQCAGAVGVSGATSDIDEQVAAAGVTLMDYRPRPTPGSGRYRPRAAIADPG